MAKRYHINLETKEVGICSAEIRCKFATNGEEPQHYHDPIEAHKAAEKDLEKEYGGFQIQRPLNVEVHASHCCKKHWCKYRSENCPVVKGEVEAKYPCEYCEMDEEEDMDDEL